MDVRNYLNELKIKFDIKNDTQLAKELSVSKSAFDKWIVRNKIPERILKDLVKKDYFDSFSSKTIKINHISNKLSDSIHVKIGELIMDKSFFNSYTENLFTLQLEENYLPFPSKSWIIFNDRKEFQGDDLYIIIWNNLLMIKKIIASPKKNILQVLSLNEEEKAWEFSLDNNNSFSLFGRVVKTIK